eukprot:6692015-Prymnesium_polylepis.1
MGHRAFLRAGSIIKFPQKNPCHHVPLTRDKRSYNHAKVRSKQLEVRSSSSMATFEDDLAMALRLQMELTPEASDSMAEAIRTAEAAEAAAISEAADAADAAEVAEAAEAAEAALRAVQDTEGAAMAAEIERELAVKRHQRVQDCAPARHHVVSGPGLHDSGSAKISASIFTAHLVSEVCNGDSANTALGTMRAWVRQQPWAPRVVCMPWAYRAVGSDGNVLKRCDDDGEFGAGGKLALLLDSCKASNVLVGVTRQGGRLPHCSQFSLTKFGQHRWPHFVGSARALVEQGHGHRP